MNITRKVVKRFIERGILNQYCLLEAILTNNAKNLYKKLI